MKRFYAFLIFLMSIMVHGGLWTTNSFSQDLPVIVPVPQEMKSLNVTFSITSETKIILGKGCGAQEQFAVEEFNAKIRELAGYRLSVVQESTIQDFSNSILFGRADLSMTISQHLADRGLIIKPEMQKEGYIIDLQSTSAVVTANSPQGLLYAAMTLNQLIQKEDNRISLPGATIRDWPDMVIRGISDDISRGQVSTMNNFKEIIKFLARYKMNMYQLYLEDMFLLRQYPTFGKNRGALSAEQLKEIVDFARQYYVDVVPVYQSLGHNENMLLQPEFQHLAEFPGSQVLGIGNPEIYQFLKDVYSEIIPAFPSRYFHVGCDESWDVGHGISKGQTNKIGMAETHARHYKRVYDMVKGYGKEMMMYDDIILDHPEILNLIPRDIIMVDWHYEPAAVFSSVKKVADAGFRTIVSPGVSSWSRFFPYNAAATVNIRNITAEGKKCNVLGMINSNWGDFGGKNLRELALYGYAYSAVCSWNVAKSEVQDFERGFFKDYFGDNSSLLPVVYSFLGELAEKLNFWSFFAPPFIPEKYVPAMKLADRNKLRTQLNLVLQLTEELYKSVQYHKEHLDYLRFIAHSGLWYIHQLGVQEAINRLIANNSPETGSSLQKQIPELAQPVVGELKQLKETFRTLWLENNLEANLKINMNDYDYVIDGWETAIQSFKQGDYSYNPLLESQWIYHNEAPQERKSIPHAFFRKTITVREGAKQLYLQTIGDTYYKVWINGHYLGESVARWSLSSIIHQQRAKIWNTPMGRGKIVIAIEVQNFDEEGPDRQGPRGSAGINVYGEIEYEGGNVQKITSDSYWLVSDRKEDGWESTNFFDGQWHSVFADPEQHYAITKPDFIKNMNSRIAPAN